MKLCREMVEAMGGAASPAYNAFKTHSFTALSILRKSANLILNLFMLMVRSNLPDMILEPDKVVMKVSSICFRRSPINMTGSRQI
jgi:phosphatidylinositol 3-kinase